MGAAANTFARYSLDRAIIVNDLRDHPEWVLSAYGPGKDAPAQLFGGIREQSFEEMRLYHYQAAAAGKEQQAVGSSRPECVERRCEADQQLRFKTSRC